MKTKAFNLVIVFLGILPIAIWSYRYLEYDLWYDEVFSLEHFGLVDFSTTLFHYPSPNNHIFYNLTTQVLSRLFGLRTIIEAEEYTAVFRLFQLLVSIVTAVFSFKIVRRFFEIKNPYLLLVLLFTTIPFINFSLQLRGYGLSGMFLVMLIYYSWVYLEVPKKRVLLVVLGLSTLILYTIPSNLYVLGGLCASISLFWIFYLKETPTTLFKNSTAVLVAIGIGVVLAVMLYLPIWKELVYNKFANKSASNPFEAFMLLFYSIPQFLSKRYLLLVLFVPGIFYIIKKSDAKVQRFYLALLSVFLVPFLVSFLHQKAPYSRVFVPLAPVFSMLIGVPIIVFLASLSSKKSILLQILVSVFCVGIFIVEINKNDIVVSKNLLENNTISQNLYRNYYLGDFFKQDETMKYLATLSGNKPIIKMFQRDEPSTDFYLKKQQLKAINIESAALLQPILRKNSEVFLITSHKNRVIEALKDIEGIEIDVLTKENTFTSILSVSLKAQ